VSASDASLAAAPAADPPPDAAAPDAAAPDAAAPDAAAPDVAVPVVGDGAPVVSFRFPRVATEPPALTVLIRNATGRALPMVTFGSPACFAHFMMRIHVTPRGGEPLPSRVCPVKDFPGTPTTIAAGTELQVVLPLGEVFPAIGTGTFEIDVAWDVGELRDALGPDAGFEVMSWSVTDTQFTVAKAKKEFVIRRGQSVKLPGGATLTFAGHSHKRVLAGSGPGPLIVGGRFAAPRLAAQDFSASLFPDEGPAIFDLGPDDGPQHTFELLAWEYDASMTLRYYGALR
jgi:hypothetical protein